MDLTKIDNMTKLAKNYQTALLTLIPNSKAAFRALNKGIEKHNQINDSCITPLVMKPTKFTNRSKWISNMKQTLDQLNHIIVNKMILPRDPTEPDYNTYITVIEYFSKLSENINSLNKREFARKSLEHEIEVLNKKNTRRSAKQGFIKTKKNIRDWLEHLQ